MIVPVVELTPRCAMLRSKRSSAAIHFLLYPAREHAEPILHNPNKMVRAVPDGMYALAFEIGSFDAPSGALWGQLTVELSYELHRQIGRATVSDRAQRTRVTRLH